MTPEMARDYAYYQAKYAVLQEQENLAADLLGEPARDLAWEKAVDREKARHTPAWEQMQAEFRRNRETSAYRQAIKA